jgi:hypothetical protein
MNTTVDDENDESEGEGNDTASEHDESTEDGVSEPEIRTPPTAYNNKNEEANKYQQPNLLNKMKRDVLIKFPSDKKLLFIFLVTNKS